MRSLSPACLLLLVAACGSLDLPSGQIQCGAAGQCPRDMACGGDGLCHAGGDPVADAAAALPADAGGACPGGLRELSDDFDDLAAWTVLGGGIESCFVEAQDGVLVVHTSVAGTCGIRSVGLHGLVDQSAALHIADDNQNQGNPDLVFRLELAARTVQLVWFDGAMTAMNCPASGGCGTSGIPGGIRAWWRLRHDPVQAAIVAELSDTGVDYAGGVALDLGGDDPTCARVFIGTTGQLTGDPMAPIRVDRLNDP